LISRQSTLLFLPIANHPLPLDAENMARKTASDSTASESPHIREKILKLFMGKPRLRLTPLEIARRAGLKQDDLQVIIDSLRRLVREGRMVRLKKNHYALPDSANLMTGRVHAHPDGYGFLILDDRNGEDLYLNRREMRRVMHGDRAMVRVHRNKRGSFDVRIVQVLERAHKRLIGTYDEIKGHGYLVPMDPRIAGAILLKPGGERPEKGKIIAA
jgi:ribonuclease R